MKEVRVTIVQMNSLAGDPARNLSKMRSFIESNESSDIICFPEMCLSGYSTVKTERFALDPDNPYVANARNLATEYGTAIVFGYIEKDKGYVLILGGKLYLRSLQGSLGH